MYSSKADQPFLGKPVREQEKRRLKWKQSYGDQLKYMQERQNRMVDAGDLVLKAGTCTEVTEILTKKLAQYTQSSSVASGGF